MILTNNFSSTSILCVIDPHFVLGDLICKLEDQNRQCSLQSHESLNFGLVLEVGHIAQHMVIFLKKIVLMQITLKFFQVISNKSKILGHEWLVNLVVRQFKMSSVFGLVVILTPDLNHYWIVIHCVQSKYR